MRVRGFSMKEFLQKFPTLTRNSSCLWREKVPAKGGNFDVLGEFFVWGCGAVCVGWGFELWLGHDGKTAFIVVTWFEWGKCFLYCDPVIM